MPRVLLIDPPLRRQSTSMYLSLPVLAGYLESKGVGVDLLNLNRDFMGHLFSPETVERQLDEAERTVDALQHKGEALSPDDGSDYYDAFLRVMALTYAAERCEEDGAGDWWQRQLATEGESSLHQLFESCFAANELVFDLRDEAQWESRYEAAKGRHEIARYLERLDLESRLGPEHVLVGITVPMESQVAPALLLADEVKRRFPELPVCLGGPFVSLLDEALWARVLERCGADYLIRREGEVPLERLVRALAEGTPDALAGVPNLIRATDDGLVVHPQGPILPLAELPPARYAPEDLAAPPDDPLPVLFSRGCYWGRCAYCDHVNLHDAHYRERPIPLFVDEMERLYRDHGRRSFHIRCETIHVAQLTELCREILARDLPITWTSFLRVDPRFTKEMAALMKRSGCDFIQMGIESFTDRVLKRIRKGYKKTQAYQHLEALRGSGIRVMVNMIVDLPGATVEDAEHDMRCVEENQDVISDIFPFRFRLTTSSAMGQDPDSFGIAIVPGETDARDDLCSTGLAYEDPSGMTEKERREVFERFLQLKSHILEQRMFAAAADQAEGDDAPGELRIGAETALTVKPHLVCFRPSLYDLTQAKTAAEDVTPQPCLVAFHGGADRFLALPLRFTEMLAFASSQETFTVPELMDVVDAEFDVPPRTRDALIHQFIGEMLRLRFLNVA